MTTADFQSQFVAQHFWRFTPDMFAEHCSIASPTGKRFVAWAYLQYIGQKIAAAVTRGRGRLLINLPSGHGKSTLISHWTPTWFLDNWPERRAIIASHGDSLASDWGRIVRNEFDRNRLLTTRLATDSKAADQWNTPRGGGLKTTGIGGGITGFRGDLLIIDDVHATWQKAMSYSERALVREWFSGTFYDRAEPNATMIVLMHRWHEDDLAGYLIDEHPDEWDIVRLPALAESGDPLGRAVGEALCPERFSADELQQQALGMTQHVFDAKFQQNPKSVGGGRLYENYLPALHDDKALLLQDQFPLDVCFDFNKNPGMHVEIAQFDNHNDIGSVVHEIHGPGMKLAPALDALTKLISSYGTKFRWQRMCIFGDASGTQERAETTQTCWQMVDAWAKRNKYPVRYFVPRANPPVVSRVDTVNDALKSADGDVHLKLHPTQCPRLAEDFRAMKPDEHGMIDKHDAKLSHGSDAVGYWLCVRRPLRSNVPISGKVLFSRR